MKEGIKNIWLSTEVMVVSDNKLWFAEIDSNEVYSYDIKTRKCSLVCSIAEEEKAGKRLFGAIVSQDEFLYLFPFSAKSAYKVNKYTGHVKRIPIKEPRQPFATNYRSDKKFFSAIAYEDSIFAVGCTFPSILEYRIQTGDVIYHDKIFEEIRPYIRDNAGVLFRKVFCREGRMYAPLCCGNAVLVFDLAAGSHRIYEVGTEQCRFVSICFDGQAFWLAPHGNNLIVRWYEESNAYDIHDVSQQGIEEGVYNDIVYYRNEVILLPGKTNAFLKINRTDEFNIQFERVLCDWPNITQCLTEGILYLFSSKDAVLIVAREDGNTIETHRIEKIVGVLEGQGRGKYIYEGKYERVKAFEEYVAGENMRSVIVQKPMGIKVWEMVK